MRRRVRAWAALACGACLLWVGAARGHEAPPPPDLRGVLQGLEQGIVALEKLGNTEESNRLRHIADEVRAAMQSAQRQPAPPPGEEPRPGPQGIDVMRMAEQALVDAGRNDAAESLERAIHARRMDVDGRDDDEAAQIRRQAPLLVEQIEVLRMAARLLKQNGQPDRAGAVAAMAERMWQRAAAGRMTNPPGPPQAPPRGADAQRGRVPDDAALRLDAIERQIEELRRALDQTRQQLRELAPPPGPGPDDGERR